MCKFTYVTNMPITSDVNVEIVFNSLYPFQTVTSVEDDGRQQNVEKHFWIKGHL